MFHRWTIFDRGLFAEMLFDFHHPILTMLTTPIICFVLFSSLILSISAVGKNGIIPAVSLLIALILMRLLITKVYPSILFVWVQPFICYAEFIFTKCALKNNSSEPGVGVIGFFMFAAIALVILVYTGITLDNKWGIIYLIPYGTAWIFSLTHQNRVYYIIVYMVVFAVIVTIFIVLRSLIKKDKELSEFIVLPIILVFFHTLFAFTHSLLSEYDPSVILMSIKEIHQDPNSVFIVRAFASILDFLIHFPLTKALGSIINKLVSILASYG
ncbi:MAG: hypothetical protein K5886_00935 [Lachnospiraceae bacterium]|nr:hypothetical protein [Lachnospiraceae bacterium]